MRKPNFKIDVEALLIFDWEWRCWSVCRYSRLILVASMTAMINIRCVTAILSISTLSSSKERRWIDITVLCHSYDQFHPISEDLSHDKTNIYSVNLYRFINTAVSEIWKHIIFNVWLDIITIVRNTLEINFFDSLWLFIRIRLNFIFWGLKLIKN